ncbi:MAG: ABC transporter permease [Verrucomicrobia bacterium]|nr:ABC transporter permease [Verrucomicrobiota bacterium]
MMKSRGSTLFLAEARESFAMAMNALAAHKLRSALTLLGVLIGVFSIIVVMTAMRVLKRNIETEMSQLGSHTFAIQKWPAVQFGGPKDWEKYWRRKNISLAHGQQVVQKATLAGAVGLEGNFWGGQVETRFQKTAPDVRMLGETPGSFPARNWTVAEGRGLIETDVENARDVCVLGATLAKTVFPFGSAVGERLKLNGINYTVIGVLEPKGASLGGEQDNFAIVPITTALDRFGRWWVSLSILVQARDAASYEDCVEEVRGILRVARKVPPGAEDDFELFSNDSLIEQFNTFTIAVRIGVVVVSSISLLAAGIGIMNIMLVSVSERTREIGIRKAIGATRKTILTQFLIEAVVICQIGGVIGIIMGLGGGNILALMLDIPPVLPIGWALLGVVVTTIIGIVFGVYPAWKASNLDPIEALRYE